jgi:hypothetical protein
VVKLPDGTLLAGSRTIDTNAGFHDVELDFAGQRSFARSRREMFG